MSAAAADTRTCSACNTEFTPPAKAPEAGLCFNCYRARKEALRVLPETAKGRWPEILVALGIDRDALVDDHRECPGCGGTDRFRFDDKDARGTWICGQGGDTLAGDGFNLLSHVLGWEPAESYLAVARYFGIPDLEGTATTPPPKPVSAPVKAPQRRDLGQYARQLWARVERDDSVVAGHPYAIAKGINWACGAGRAIASGRKLGREADCIVVPIRTPEGDVCAVECLADHRDKAGKFVRQAFGDKSKGWLTIGNDLDPTIPRYCVEGWATGARLARAKRNCCILVAFGSGRLFEVAEHVERIAPGTDVLVFGEAAHA